MSMPTASRPLKSASGARLLGAVLRGRDLAEANDLAAALRDDEARELLRPLDAAAQADGALVERRR